MDVKTVLGECIVKMGEKDFTSQTEYTAAQSELLERLLAAMNVVYREIAAEYLPALWEETVVAQGGSVAYDTLSERIIYPLKLRDEQGAKVAYASYPDRIITKAEGRLVLTYAYMPKALTLDGVVPDKRLTPAVLANGTLGEYYFENKLFDLAKAHDTQFRSALSALRFKGREISMKAGRWGA